VATVLDALGALLPREVARLLRAPDLTPAQRADFLLGLLPYCYPRLTPIAPQDYLHVDEATALLRQVGAVWQTAVWQYAPDAAPQIGAAVQTKLQHAARMRGAHQVQLAP
jgi:hypothetical protein